MGKIMVIPYGNGQTVFVAFPAYNAMPGLKWVFRSLDWLESNLKDEGCQLRVLFVVDPSTDGTQSRIMEFARIRENVEVIFNNDNMGNTWNIRRGERWALENGGPEDIYVSCDADGEFNLLDVLWFLDELPHRGVVVGSVSYPQFRLSDDDAAMMRELGAEQARRARADSSYTLQSPGFKLMSLEELRRVVAWFGRLEQFVLVPLPRWGYHGAFLELAGRFAELPIHVCCTACRGEAPNRTDEKREQQRGAAERYFQYLDALEQEVGAQTWP